MKLLTEIFDFSKKREILRNVDTFRVDTREKKRARPTGS